jgi:hypothetical protein
MAKLPKWNFMAAEINLQQHFTRAVSWLMQASH